MLCKKYLDRYMLRRALENVDSEKLGELEENAPNCLQLEF